MTGSDKMTNIDELRLKNRDCERFSTLVENRWVDEQPLSESDSVFYCDHKNTCFECSKYDEMLLIVADYSEVTETEDAVSAQSIQNILNQKFDGLSRSSAGRSGLDRTVQRRNWVFVAWAASLLLCGLVAVFFALKDKESALDESMRFGLSKGALVLGGRNISLGERFAFEAGDTKIPTNALIEIPRTLYIAIEKDARIDFVEHRSDLVLLRLNQGRAAIHLIPGSKLHVKVEMGGSVVEVKGTIFIVDASRRGESVEVLQGAVKVSSKAERNAQAETVDAGFKLSLRDSAPSKRQTLPNDPLLALLGIVEAAPKPPVEEVSASPATALQIPESGEPARTPAASRPSAESLLRAAGECRAAKDWECAEENFAKVIEYYPGLPDAATAMLPLAEILLENQSRPKEALLYFKRYQKRRPESGLGQEALFGECRSLEKMGRMTEEKTCLEQYLAKYPNSLYTQMAKSRLMGIMVKD
jgi:TolA-binding protein